MTEKERRLLKALAWMAEQYLSTGKGNLDHMYMHAGEGAVRLLAEYDLVVDKGRDSEWTDAVHQFLMQSD